MEAAVEQIRVLCEGESKGRNLLVLRLKEHKQLAPKLKAARIIYYPIFTAFRFETRYRYNERWNSDDEKCELISIIQKFK